MPRIIRKFDTWKQWVDYCEAKSDRHGGEARNSDPSYKQWCGGLTFDESIELARTGWHEARSKVDVILDPIRERLAEILDIQFERQFDMFGSEPDIDRYLMGELDCMFEEIAIIAPTKGKAMTLIVDSVVTGNVPATEIFKRGAAIVALVETMTLLGFELEIWADMSVARGWGGTDVWTGLVRVHRAGDNIDMDQVMFAIGHPCTLRRLCFGAMEGESREVRAAFGFKNGGGYGSPCGIKETADMVDASFTISWGNRQAQQAVENPVEWVLAQLQIQGLYDPVDGTVVHA